jgi:GTP cyclohydrolase IA
MLQTHLRPIPDTTTDRPSYDEACQAVRILLRYAGDNPAREGLVDTPDRVVRAYDEFFRGYGESPAEILGRNFEQPQGYDQAVILRDIAYVSHCEHHIMPFVGKAHIAYLPKDKVVGISKLARVVEVFAKRLQIQEKLTAEIAQAIYRHLDARGVLVLLDGVHECMTLRGVEKPGVNMVTLQALGLYQTDAAARDAVLKLLRE